MLKCPKCSSDKITATKLCSNCDRNICGNDRCICGSDRIDKVYVCLDCWYSSIKKSLFECED